MVRPVDEWIERIDRGDQLRLSVSGHVLIAGRLAGWYAVKDGDECWFNPAITPTAAVARHRLRGRLARFQAGKHVATTWRENIAEVNDPFESTEYALVSSETGTGGSCAVTFARQPDGEYLKTTTLNNDWDPLGSGPPTVRTERLSETEARAEIEDQMRRRGFPPL